MTSSRQHRWIKRTTLGWLLAAQGVAILPLFIYLPLWVPVVWLATLAWRIQIFRGAWPFPGNTQKFILGILCIAGLLFSYGGTMGVEPLVAFLVISFVLKLVEVKSRVDALQIIYVGFVAIAAQFLFFQTVFIALYGILSVVFLLAAWNCIYRTNADSIKRQLKTSSLLLVQSLPLMLLLFIVLPRAGTLWSVPVPQSSGKTGFSDTMSPGDFSQLSQSREVAFRVTFEQSDESKIPPRRDWYWRGLVLDRFDGRNWQRDPRSDFIRQSVDEGAPGFWRLQLPENAALLEYKVMLEPHLQQWLFTLMAPMDVDWGGPRLYFGDQYLVFSSQPVAARSQYRAISTLDYQAHPMSISEFTRRQNTFIPNDSNPRSVVLSEQWRAENLSDQAIIERALQMYRASFTYTLQPPALGDNATDAFLFDTQRGFCEHFASSFVVLMRAAGIPARVVVGYQGGELSPVENYVIVRQSDAHAWAEVWLENQGWTRVDPTAAVSPSRIERGLRDSVSGEERNLINPIFSGSFANYIQMRLDAFSYSWHQWVLGYDTRTQQGLFERIFGGTQVWRIAGGFGLAVSLMLLIYYLMLTRGGKPQFSSEEARLFGRLLSRLKRRGYQMKAGETPLQFAERIQISEPHWGKEVVDLTQLFVAIAYSGQNSRMEEFRRKLRKFRA